VFRKIVSNLPFSPTLIGQLGFYAKRLQKEETTRRLGLTLTALALIVQSFTVFLPPESANAAHPSNLVNGGLPTKSSLLSAWDNDTQGYRELLNYIGIDNRSYLENAKESYVTSRSNGRDNNWLSWGRISHGSTDYDETVLQIGSQTIYVRSLAAFDTGNNLYGSGSYYEAYIGKNNKGEEFVILKSCANIAMQSVPKPEPEIKVCDLHSKEIITIKKSQFDSSKYSKNQEDCEEKPEPVALCSSLTVKKLSRTTVRLEASASADNGATINSYTYIIKDKDGNEVMRETANSASTNSSIQYELTKDGTYSASVIVSTSVGDKTGSACQEDFTVEPIKKCALNPSLPIDSPDCQPCPSDETLWVKDEACSAKVIRNKQAQNLTQNVDATTSVAKPSNRIEYTLTAKNEGKADAEFELKDNLRDVLEYASLYDPGNGTLKEDTKDLTWGTITLRPGEQQQRTYVIQIANEISPMSRGSSEPTSYDCQIYNVFGNTVTVAVECPAPKVVEQTVTELPKTGATENLIVGGVIAAVVTFFYLRSRQLNKEVRLIRHEVTAGTI
jgi:hypothetical protein